MDRESEERGGRRPVGGSSTDWWQVAALLDFVFEVITIDVRSCQGCSCRPRRIIDLR
jgi:hypothetical protein